LPTRRQMFTLRLCNKRSCNETERLNLVFFLLFMHRNNFGIYIISDHYYHYSDITLNFCPTSTHPSSYHRFRVVRYFEYSTFSIRHRQQPLQQQHLKMQQQHILYQLQQQLQQQQLQGEQLQYLQQMLYRSEENT